MGVQNIVSLYTFGTTEMVYVHPTFLYESLWNLLGVLLIYLYARYLHKKYDGELFIMTFGWYGLGRMFIEGLRMDSLYSEIFGLEFRTSQVLAAAIFIVCLALYIYFLIKRPNKPFFYKEVALAEGEESGSDDKKDGKETNPAISFVLNQKAAPNTELEKEYRTYCERLGFIANEKGSFGVKRKYWKLG
jgi:phosphatidylglycerol:prolipoprotein diacylglycerol transferase